MNRFMTKLSVANKVCAAIDKLLERDLALLELNVNERSVSYRLAFHLQEQFPEWDVDCEYNRLGDAVNTPIHGTPKRTPWREQAVKEIKTDDIKGQTVYPDIIVHHRKTKENLLIIEIKLSSNDDPDGTDDEKKLRAYKSDPNLNYEYALFLSFEVGNAVGIRKMKWIR